MAKILVIEDEQPIARSVIEMLEFDRHVVDWSEDGDQAWEHLQRFQYDLVILDWHLPDTEGIRILESFRAIGGRSAVIFLTGRNSLEARVSGLNAGADDYLCKPFHLLELQARVNTLLRRPNDIKADALMLKDLTINSKEFTCKRGAETIKLLPREFSLLEFLIQNRNQVFTPDQLLDRLWPGDKDIAVSAIRQTITRLRSKLESGTETTYIKTVMGVGYKVED